VEKRQNITLGSLHQSDICQTKPFTPKGNFYQKILSS